MPIEIKWHADLPIFASESFLKSLDTEYGWLGGTDAAGKLRCILPYTVIRKLGFRFVRFRVETLPNDGNLSLHDEQSFLTSTVAYFRSLGMDMIIPATNTALFRTYPDGSLAAPYGTFINDLTKPEGESFAELHADYRQNIRKAEKKGIEIRSGLQYLEETYRLLAGTLKRSGLRFKSYQEFERNVSNLGENVKIFVALSDGTIQACMVSPFSQHSAFDWYSGTIVKPARGAMHLLIWEAMRQFRQQRVKQFNFTGVRIGPQVGSKQEGIANFKRRFGGELVQGYMWKYSLHRLKSLAYSVTVRALLGGDVVDVERSK